MAMKDLVNDTYLKLREAVIVFATENKYGSKNDFEKIKITEDEDIFCSGVSDLLTDLKDLEVNVEDIRSSVINKKNKISIQDVENLAMMLSRSSKKVTIIFCEWTTYFLRRHKIFLIIVKIFSGDWAAEEAADDAAEAEPAAALGGCRGGAAGGQVPEGDPELAGRSVASVSQGEFIKDY